ncbi:porin family protein [Danxiaibacter flavus]|uniref:Porin family protein n=1 Tax=Danxiaibacter flavus TaxID=3049108 RepID=A0ABV3ZNK9_9BACT|nr:porin family protein [Chitinophagaceae bacterium DXS]
MKHLFLSVAVICFFLLGNTAKAQEFGIKGGMSFTDLSNLSGNNRVTGHAGVFLNKRLDRFWSIQPEILYAGMGQRYYTINGDQRTIALDYIQIPFMFQVHPVKQFYFEFGPQLGFNVGANLKYADGDKIGIKDGYSSADVALNLGMGIDANRMLGFYVRYGIGLTDITLDDHRTRANRGVQLGASIKFPG